VTEETLKITEELVLLTLALRDTPKCFIWNCRITEKIYDRNTKHSERDIYAQMQHFALHY